MAQPLGNLNFQRALYYYYYYYYYHYYYYYYYEVSTSKMPCWQVEASDLQADVLREAHLARHRRHHLPERRHKYCTISVTTICMLVY